MIYNVQFCKGNFFLVFFIDVFVFLLQTGQKEPSPGLDKAIENWYKKTRDLRRQVRNRF